jgi:hypothetical protein
VGLNRKAKEGARYWKKKPRRYKSKRAVGHAEAGDVENIVNTVKEGLHDAVKAETFIKKVQNLILIYQKLKVL